VKKQLFGARTDVVGQEVAINSIPYKIVGVMADKEQNSSYSGLDEKKVWLPYTTMTRDVPPTKYYVPGYLDEILYQPRSLEQFEEARAQVRKIVARAHDFNPADKSAMGIWDTVENSKLTAGIFDSMTVFLGFIALVTLSLGGIGVMNIMLVSVSERTKEIGVRSAVGARRSDILIQFLIEAVLVCLLGGGIGVLLAYGLASLFTAVAKGAFVMSLSLGSVIAAFAFSTLIGVVFGFMPARNAARLDPIEALARE